MLDLSADMQVDWNQFDDIIPYLTGIVGVLVLSLFIGLTSVRYIPQTYVNKPWAEDSVTNEIGIKITTPLLFFGVWLVLLLISFLSSLVQSLIGIWRWEVINFSGVWHSKRSTPGASKRGFKLLFVAVVGEFVIATASLLGLFFSATHISYLVAMGLGRSLSMLTLAEITHRRAEAGKINPR